jgi:serine protease Do
MNDILLLDAVERYIRGEMNPDERLLFENLRKTNPETDQLVVEHTLFLQQMNRFGEWHKFKSTLQDVHTNLAQQGKIDSARLTGRAKVVYLWKRYKRVAAIAAIIAGVTTLTVSAMVYVLSPKVDNAKLQELGRDIQVFKRQQNVLGTEVKDLKNKMIVPPIPFKAAGSGFLIDGRGYLVTNAHIIRNSKNIVVINSKNEQFRARVVKMDLDRDLAILKIDDDSFKILTILPYGIRKSSTDVAEPIYTLGYPRNEIVYSEGYLSAKTGFNGDTLSCQLGIAANRGNSGGPVFNHDGEIIGVISTKETEAEGVAFAIQSKYIFDAVDELKKDTTYQSLHLPVKSTLKGLDKSQQVKKIQDYVFMVKGD